MKTKHKISCAPHLTTMLNPARAKYTAKQVVKMIKARGLQFDAIACRGVSSLLISPIVAMRLNKSLIVVRKGEKTHSAYKVEGDHGAKRYLIIDDFIDSGDTIREIAKDIFDVNKDAQCVGFIAYRRLSFKDSGNSFETEMKSAWWDGEKAPSRFFTAQYTARHGEVRGWCRKEGL